MMSTKAEHEALEIGVSAPGRPEGSRGRRGRLPHHRRERRAPVEGRRHRHDSEAEAAEEALPGYTDPKPMVFSGLYPIDGSDYPVLREALDKLKLSDAALQYEPETSVALGFGFAAAFSASCTSRSSASACAASSISTSSPRPRAWSTRSRAKTAPM